MIHSPDTEWLTPKALADELVVPLRTVYAWRSSGHGPIGVRFGKHLRFRRADVDRWIAERMNCESAT